MRYDEALTILGVFPGEDIESIKKKYRQLVLVHHPDHGGDPVHFSKIITAYRLLEEASKLSFTATVPKTKQPKSSFNSASKDFIVMTLLTEVGIILFFISILFLSLFGNHIRYLFLGGGSF